MERVPSKPTIRAQLQPIIPGTSAPERRRNLTASHQSARSLTSPLRPGVPAKGQIKGLEPLLHNAFTSLKIPNLRLYVKQHGLPLASKIAQHVQDTSERNPIPQTELKRGTTQETDCHRHTEGVKKSAQQARRQRIYARTSFLTLKVNKHALHNIVSAQVGRKSTHPKRATPGVRQNTEYSTAFSSHSAPANPSTSVCPVKASECPDWSHSSNSTPILQQEFPLTPPSSHSSPDLLLSNSDEILTGRLFPEPPGAMSDPSAQDLSGIDDKIKDVIQNLYEFQQHIQGFRPEQLNGLVTKVDHIASSLKDLHTASQDETNPVQHIRVAPDIIDYVDAGRNPDIYTREFVELVQRGNSVMKGKQKAFRDFSRIFAKALKDNFDGMDDEVDTIMRHSGIGEQDGQYMVTQRNGHSA